MNITITKEIIQNKLDESEVLQMNKTKEANRFSGNEILVNDSSLQALLGCGRPTAVKIAAAAGAKVKIGSRALYKVAAIKEYVNQLETK